MLTDAFLLLFSTIKTHKMYLGLRSLNYLRSLACSSELSAAKKTTMCSSKANFSLDLFTFHLKDN